MKSLVQKDCRHYSNSAKTPGTLALGRFNAKTDLLRLNFVLMVIPGANGGINKAAKEKQETDKQYDAGHPGVKSMSFSHTRSLTHFLFLSIPFWAIRLLRHSRKSGSIRRNVK